MKINVFGSLRVTVAGHPVTAINTNRLHSLLAYLVLHADTPQPRERLAFLLWPQSNEAQARTNLRQLLHHLKRALPANCTALATDHFTVQWRLDASCVIDAVVFRTAIAEAAAAREVGDGARERQALSSAAQVYEDDLLPGLYDEWITPLREDYKRQMGETMHRLATLCEAQGDIIAAIPWAERLVALDWLGEAHYQLLIRLHAANNDRASAMRAYHQCMRVLRREMGMEPGAATVALFEKLLHSETAPGASGGKPVPHLQTARTLIGRRREWMALAAAWQEVVAEGPRVAIISGEPGIGKTRLAEELYESCIRNGHAGARCRCYAGQGQLPYAPVAEWLRSDTVRAGLPNLTSQQLVELARLAPEIREQYPDLDQAPPLTESWHRVHFYESLTAAFGRTRKPVVLFLDDLQWCDPDSFEWLLALLRTAAARGVLVLGTVRAEETGREHPFTRFLGALRQAGIVTEIPLTPLDSAETEELARSIAIDSVESADVGAIFRVTKGNPLFVVESVRAGLQSTRVHAVIAARFERLSTAAYELAGLASVVGRPFSFELLEKATDWDERSLSQALEQLWQSRIIEDRGGAEYDFTHDRLREVAYAELSVVRQRYLHRRVARALADVHSAGIESWDGQIASHLELAGMAGEAIGHYRRAAGFARQRYADKEASDLLRRALRLCRGLPISAKRNEDELDLLITLGPSLVTTEGYSAPEVGETYARALEHSRRLSDRGLFAILTGAWVYHIVRGDLDKSREFGCEFLRAAEREPTPALMLAGNFILGSSLFHLGQMESSQEHMTRASLADTGPQGSVLELFAGPDAGVSYRSYLAHLAWHRGQEGADEHAAGAIAAAERRQHPFSRAIALDYATMLHVFQGRSASALERGRAAVELCSRHGFAYYLAMANVLTGWAAAAEGEVAAGLTRMRAGLDAMKGLGAELRLPFYFALLAETLGRAGQTGEALASLSSGFAFVSKNGEEWAAAELHRVQGDLLVAEGKGRLAHESYRRGFEAARRSGCVALERRIVALQNALRTPHRA